MWTTSSIAKINKITSIIGCHNCEWYKTFSSSFSTTPKPWFYDYNIYDHIYMIVNVILHYYDYDDCKWLWQYIWPHLCHDHDNCVLV